MKMNSEKQSKALAEHFFRLEYSKIVSVVTRYFGLSKVNMAEDIVQDTLLEAINSWDYKGIPENPSAWLYTVAKNKAINALRKIKQEEAYQTTNGNSEESIEITFSEDAIVDDQLRMMFACCHPSISHEAQVSLILKTLCGLSIGEIANAFLTSNETINKRLVRARRVLKEEQISFEIPNNQVLDQRLEAVLKTIFLLFNEGYSTSKGDQLINYDLCLEAIRLVELIANHPQLNQYSSPNALLALMLLNAARFKARVDEDGCMIRMVHQDRSLWNQALINGGLQHLQKIADHAEVSIYHMLATISAYHCVAKNYESTDWQGILNMYDALVAIDNSSLVRLNRAIALSRVEGPILGVQELLKLEDEIPTSYYLFHSTLADLYMEMGQHQSAIKYLKMALELKIGEAEKAIIQKRVEACEQKLK